MEDKNYKDIFERKEEPEKKEKKSFVATPKLKTGKVATIILPKEGRKGEIIIDHNGNGERIDYIAERHSQLKVGDKIDF